MFKLVERTFGFAHDKTSKFRVLTLMGQKNFNYKHISRREVSRSEFTMQSPKTAFLQVQLAVKKKITGKGHPQRRVRGMFVRVGGRDKCDIRNRSSLPWRGTLKRKAHLGAQTKIDEFRDISVWDRREKLTGEVALYVS